MIKILIRKVLGSTLYGILVRIKTYLFNIVTLIYNTFKDGRLFYKYSMVFKLDSYNKLESQIILHYHGIEKGFLHNDFKPRFGKNRIIEIITLLKNKDIVKNHIKTQLASAYLAVCQYYEKHKIIGIDISDYFPQKDYEYFKSLSTLDLEIVKNQERSIYFTNSDKNFENFSKSRSSVRNFTGENVSFQTLNKVIELAKTAPSVCNRQPIKVYCIENKKIIDEVLQLQKGLRGYTDEITQILILTSDRNYFYSVGERNQLYIDGGIFLMNLLYALHFYKIGACPAHWGFNYSHDVKIQRILNLTNSEKVICLIPIGIPKKEFKTTLSLRRNNEEILKMIR